MTEICKKKVGVERSVRSDLGRERPDSGHVPHAPPSCTPCALGDCIQPHSLYHHFHSSIPHLNLPSPHISLDFQACTATVAQPPAISMWRASRHLKFNVPKTKPRAQTASPTVFPSCPPSCPSPKFCSHSCLLSFSRIPQPICWENFLALSSIYRQNLSISTISTATPLVGPTSVSYPDGQQPPNWPPVTVPPLPVPFSPAQPVLLGEVQTCLSSAPHPPSTPTSSNEKTALKTAHKAPPDLISPSRPRPHLPQSHLHSPLWGSPGPLHWLFPFQDTLPQRSTWLTPSPPARLCSDVTFSVMCILSTLFKTETSTLYPGSSPTQFSPRSTFIFYILYSDAFTYYVYGHSPTANTRAPEMQLLSLFWSLMCPKHSEQYLALTRY